MVRFYMSLLFCNLIIKTAQQRSKTKKFAPKRLAPKRRHQNTLDPLESNKLTLKIAKTLYIRITNKKLNYSSCIQINTVIDIL